LVHEVKERRQVLHQGERTAYRFILDLDYVALYLRGNAVDLEQIVEERNALALRREDDVRAARDLRRRRIFSPVELGDGDQRQRYEFADLDAPAVVGLPLDLVPENLVEVLPYLVIVTALVRLGFLRQLGVVIARCVDLQNPVLELRFPLG